MTGGAFSVPAGAVILHGRGLVVAAYAVQVAQKARARNGLPPSADLERLAVVLAAPSQSDSPPEVADEADYMTTREAATALKVSRRTASRLAPRLGGRKVGGQWLVDRQAVAEHNGGNHAQED